ncbi:MAG: adenylate kinase [Oscillospiraceae bacterium]|nr:adenylate kinase [Oscillospiraceae bacterium]
MRIILLGAPGAGKGTQAEIVSKRLSIPVISTGNILREAMKNLTELGKQAKSFVESGALVPDDVIIGILNERLADDDCLNGFILDGVPRTIVQADAIANMGILIDKVVNIAVPDEVIIERMSGRRVCVNCGASYHISYNAPKTEDICDSCGETLIIRDDDKKETVEQRLAVYTELTKPLIGYYKKLGKLSSVNGDAQIDDITRDILAALEK